MNDQPLQGITLVERLADGRLVLPAEAWAEARLSPADAVLTLADGRTAYALEAVPGIKYDLDMARLVLMVTAPASAFEPSRRDIGARDRPEPHRAPPGFYVDYDFSAEHRIDGGNSLGAAIEAVAFRGADSVVSGLAWRSSGRGSDAFRTDTYWRRDLPGRMETVVVGDTISSAGGWSRPVRYGGVRYARDFSIAPGYITYPMPSISGSAALPSTVEVLINNRRGPSSDVPPGPFELSNIPIVSGAGEIQLVVRDLLGRESLISQPYYVAPQLLARGFTDFSYEAGKLREGYGTGQDRYDRPFAAGTYRRGMSDWFTGEVRVEAERDRKAAGLALTAVISRLGVVGIAAGWSDADGRRGGHYVASAQRVGPRGGASFSWSHSDRDYRPFGAREDELLVRDQFTATVGARLGRGFTGGINFTRRTDWAGEKFSLFGANAGLQFRGGSFLGISASHRLEGDEGWTAGINFVMPLGRRRLLGVSSTRQSDGALVNSVEALRSAPTGPGWGWSVRASDSAAQQLRAEMLYRGNAGEVGVETSLGRGNRALRLSANGAVGRLKGLGFASRRIDQGSFAVVQVGDMPGIEVSLSNQVVATTNRNGLALVTGLLPFQNNKLSLDPDQLPLDARVDGVLATSTPFARSGSFIRFPVQRSRSALIILMQPDGSHVPAGARVSLGPGLAEFSVARRGEVYLTGLGVEHRLDVRWDSGGCTLPLPPGAGDQPASISLTCGADP